MSLVSLKETGERTLQKAMRSSGRAERFYDRQMMNSLNEKMVTLIRRQEMVFVATADAHGNCDCSPRFGKPGFVEVLDSTTLTYPEYRGNGVFASLGNILENPHVGLVFLDFFNTTVGLHVNGTAHSYPANDAPEALRTSLDQVGLLHVANVERWVVVTVEEAYIHCSKHVPALNKMDKQINWGTDDPVAKSNTFFIGSHNKPLER